MSLVKNKQILYTAGLMLFFWSIYDGILSYITPILMESRGLSNTQIGLLISVSAVSGAIFDFIISKVFRFSHYLRYFIFVFIICLTYPLLLWSTDHWAIYLLLMSAWGLIYDFINFGIYDLSARISHRSEHTQNITIIGTFKSVGYFIGPLLIAYLITNWSLSPTSLYFIYLFLAISLCFYVVLFSISSPSGFFDNGPRQVISLRWRGEIKLWRQFSHILFPILLFNTLFYIFDSAFWTIGPIFSQQFPEFKNFSILFMVVYVLPAVFVAKFAETLTSRFGKKRTAYLAFIVSSLFLLPFHFVSTPHLLLALVFCSTIFGTLAWSATAGAFIDYVSESDIHDNEIIGLKDFSANIGYIIGPTLAGITSDLFGIRSTFSLLGLLCIFVTVYLFFITPRHINVQIKN
ncbi:MFS transporter [Candidatus Shapirobacteria bacterium]|nr:MFS transporter [Candidatus Shapirobacteria bacterium]